MKKYIGITKTWGLVAGLCLAAGLIARADDATTTTEPATTTPEHHGQGTKHGQGLGQGGNGAGVTGQNREGMEKFRESLKDMTPEQRQEAIKKFKEKMGAKGGGAGGEQWREKFKDMTPEQRQEAMKKMGDKMRERIEQNPKLTAEQKKEILEQMQQFREKSQAEREKIMSDSSLNEEQKRAAMRKLMEDHLKSMREKYPHAFGQKPGESGPAHDGFKGGSGTVTNPST